MSQQEGAGVLSLPTEAPSVLTGTFIVCPCHVVGDLSPPPQASLVPRGDGLSPAPHQQLLVLGLEFTVLLLKAKQRGQ